MQVFFSVLLMFVPVIGQSGQEPPRGPGGPGEFRPDRPASETEREEWRARRRARMAEYAAAPPEVRREMRIDRIVGMLDRTYEFSDEQRETARSEVKKMQQEYYESLGPRAAEFERLQDEMSTFWSRQADLPGDPRERRPWEDPEFQKLRDQLREIREQHPFDFEASAQRVEALLPPEQAAAGRERREEFRRRMTERREDGFGPWNRGERDERRADMRQRRRRDGGDGRFNPPPPPAGDIPPPPIAPPPPPAHAWETYVRQFEGRYDLNPAQRAAVHGILKEMLSRESAYMSSKQQDFSEARNTLSPAEREARLKELQEPVSELFEELRVRLDDLLTAEQRGMP
jgi:hypothetical protein